MTYQPAARASQTKTTLGETRAKLREAIRGAKEAQKVIYRLQGRPDLADVRQDTNGGLRRLENAHASIEMILKAGG